MFPTGTAGVALLVLRVSAGVTLVVNGAGAGPLTLVGLLVLAVLLCLGFLTPYFAILTCLIESAMFIVAGGHDGFHRVISILDSGILAGLGPGAYSVDARIFGRRIVTLPPGR